MSSYNRVNIITDQFHIVSFFIYSIYQDISINLSIIKNLQFSYK